MQMEILFKKSGISNPPDACIRDNPCLPKFGTLYGLCPNVEETRNPMQTFSRKKCSHFSQTNIPSAFPHEIPKCVSYNITYHPKEVYAYCNNSFGFVFTELSQNDSLLNTFLS